MYSIKSEEHPEYASLACKHSQIPFMLICKSWQLKFLICNFFYVLYSGLAILTKEVKSGSTDFGKYIFRGSSACLLRDESRHSFMTENNLGGLRSSSKVWMVFGKGNFYWIIKYYIWTIFENLSLYNHSLV